MDYNLQRSRRKTISIQVTPRGEVVVRCPLGMPEQAVRAFVASKESWIQSKLPAVCPPLLTEEERLALTQQAKADFAQRAEYFAPLVGVSYGRITIRSQKSRWGSCSGKGNLNFNFLLMLATEEVRDYVVVHELCHRKEMNHSPKFWAEVGRVLPGYRAQRQWLKQQGNQLLARLER